VQVLIGIAASLVGVIVGAFLTRWIDASHEERRQVRETVAAALVLTAELTDSEAGCLSMAKLRTAGTSFLFAGLEEWDNHRSLFITAGMPHLQWRRLARIFRKLLEVTTALKGDGEVTLDDNWVDFLERLAGECEEARDLLAPFCIEIEAIPLRQPFSIFDT
jgi:quinol monooxygenase YgiN